MGPAAEVTEYGEAVRAVRAGELDADAAADRLIERMTDAELLGLLDGDSPRWLLPLIPLQFRSRWTHGRPCMTGRRR